MAEPLPNYPSADGVVAGEDKQSLLGNFSKKAEMYHGRIPYLRRLPFSALTIIFLIAFANAAVWVAVGIVLVSSMYNHDNGHETDIVLPQHFHPLVAIQNRQTKLCLTFSLAHSSRRLSCLTRSVSAMPWTQTTFPFVNPQAKQHDRRTKSNRTRPST